MKKNVISILILLSLVAQCYAEPVYLGVLEESQNGSGISSRLLFQKKGDDWFSAANEIFRDNSKPVLDISLVNWTVAFDGRSLGQIKIQDSEPNKKFINPSFYAREKFFSVPANQNIPKVINKSKQYGGWMKVPQYRPLVIVSQPNFVDPEHWKPFTPDLNYKRKLYVPLKLVIGKLNSFRCTGVSEEDHAVPFDFQLEDMVFYKSYVSSNGKKLVSVGLNTEKYVCDGPRPPQWADHWFLLDGESVEFLDRELTLVDSGDYDNDGRTEMLFWHSGYNQDGYILVYDSFRRKQEYLWEYH